MEAGQLNRRVKIQKKASGVDDYGQPVETWEDYATVWAWIKAPTGMGTITSEYQSESGDISRSQYSIRIRYRLDVTAKMRAVCEGTIYDIRSVIQDMAGHEYTDLVVAVGMNNG